MYNAALFAKSNYISRRDADHFTAEFNDELAEMSGRCLDIGSGTGDVVVDYFLPKLNPNATIVCSDVSEPMVNFGKEEYKDNSRVSFIKLDIESPDLPKDLIEHFDHITSSYCLHWCRDTRQAFENILNLLRPGGTTFFIMSATFPIFSAYKKLAAMPRYQPYMKDPDRYIPLFHPQNRPRQTLKALIEHVGFEVRHCSVREKSYTFDNLDILGKFMLALNPFGEHIPAELTEELKKDLVNELAAENIVIENSNHNADEYSIMIMYTSFLVYLKKPLAK